MKKNRTMRLAALLLVLTLITSCFVGGTFAKYISGSESYDTAKVANWGFEDVAVINIENLFAHEDDNVAADRIAPGTYNDVSFAIAPVTGNAPEVAYKLTVETTGSTESPVLPANVKWYLGTTTMANAEAATLSWSELLTKIAAISGEYAAGDLPANETYYVGWGWTFNDGDTVGNSQDTTDVATMRGNEVKLAIKITATQVD